MARPVPRRTSIWLLIGLLLIVAIPLVAQFGAKNGEWRAYAGEEGSTRYSPLDQITVQNVASLTEVCRLMVDDSGTFQAGLIQIEGTLYLTNSHDTLAVDATNCTLRWRNIYRPEQEEVYQINRGVAFANGRLFRGTPDGRPMALS